MAPFDRPVAKTRFGSMHVSRLMASIMAETKPTSSTLLFFCSACSQQLPALKTSRTPGGEVGIAGVPSGSMSTNPAVSDLARTWAKSSKPSPPSP